MAVLMLMFGFVGQERAVGGDVDFGVGVVTDHDAS
jgi:hypothetical protein